MQDSSVPAGQMKYFAFLSYAHRDAHAAAALGRYIETFRVPVRLGGKEISVRAPRSESMNMRENNCFSNNCFSSVKGAAHESISS